MLLSNYLNGTKNAFGDWYPSLVSGTALFDAQQDKANNYYYVTSNGDFCPDDTATITIKKPKPVAKIVIDTNLCFANSLKINNKTYNSNGIYTDTLRNTVGCDSLLYQIKINIRQEAKSSIDTMIIEGENYTINNQSFNTKGDFSIRLKNKYACDSLIQLRINVKNSDLKAYIPTVFTPESNDDNSIFRILPTAPIQLIKKIYIFNRWGQIVFKAENVKIADTNAQWNGTLNGITQQSDVYMYYIEFEENTTIQKVIGNITLIR
jgi:gliding motility-associated-like protein